MKVYLQSLFSAMAVAVAPVVATPEGLGKGFYLPSLDMKQPFEWSGTGSTILSSLNSCISTSSATDVTSTFDYYEEQHDFADNLGITTDSSVSASVVDFSASATISTAFSSATTSSSSLSSASLKSKNIVGHQSISSSCYASESAFDSDFLEDFEALPTELNLGSTGWDGVATASAATSWNDFESFLSTYGSHVITGVHMGALVEILATATTTADTSQSDFQSTACLTGSSIGISASSCVGYTSSSSSSSSSSSISTQAYYYGGDSKLAVQAQSSGDSDDLAVFLKSGSSSTPAYFTYTPLWTIMADLYGSGASVDNQKRVSILQAYFELFLAELSANVDECYATAVDYEDNDLSDQAVESEAECQALCADAPTCNWWTLREDDQCYLKTSNDGFRLSSGASSGPSSCGTKREAGYEIIVDESDSAISFKLEACEYPVADSSSCIACGNTWTSYTDTDWNPNGCSWWSCDDFTLDYCSSPSMEQLPDDWVSKSSITSHYGDPNNGCLSDETRMTVTDYDGWFCSSLCKSDSTCSADTAEGVTATPTCTLTASDGTQYCALHCSSSAECGTGTCMIKSSSSSSALCMYDQNK